MDEGNDRGHARFFLLIILICTLAVGCDSAGPGDSEVWIDVPLDGLAFPEGQTIIVEGHAAGSEVIDHVEFWVNGQMFQSVAAAAVDDALWRYEVNFLPPAPGEYTLQTIAFTSDGAASDPDTAVISVGALAAEAGITPSAVEPADSPTPTPTIPPPPEESDEPLVQFWAVPDVIDAGACTTINWHVENVESVFYAGAGQDFDGSYQDCFCEDQWLPMTIGYLDGTSEQLTLHIVVNGTCATAPPATDITPPPAPAPFKPGDGITLGCVGSTTVMWTSVSDPSGIAEYQVSVERHSGDNNWQPVVGSPFKGIDGTSASVPVECGWYYRWRVRAKDGAGNNSPWSSWWTFAVTLP